jgi:hypothetical protein
VTIPHSIAFSPYQLSIISGICLGYAGTEQKQSNSRQRRHWHFWEITTDGVMPQALARYVLAKRGKLRVLRCRCLTKLVGEEKAEGERGSQADEASLGSDFFLHGSAIEKCAGCIDTFFFRLGFLLSALYSQHKSACRYVAGKCFEDVQM